MFPENEITFQVDFVTCFCFSIICVSLEASVINRPIFMCLITSAKKFSAQERKVKGNYLHNKEHDC